MHVAIFVVFLTVSLIAGPPLISRVLEQYEIDPSFGGSTPAYAVGVIARVLGIFLIAGSADVILAVSPGSLAAIVCLLAACLYCQIFYQRVLVIRFDYAE